MGKSLSLKIITSLALAQAIAGLLRALNWVQVGVDLFGQGLLLLPFIGIVAVMRGLLIAVVALLYVLFVFGALLGQAWARWMGLAAAVVNLLLVLVLLTYGAPVASAIAWVVIPVLLIFYLFSATGRDALKDAD
jgi:Mg2+/Co2+ transporter CorB